MRYAIASQALCGAMTVAALAVPAPEVQKHHKLVNLTSFKSFPTMDPQKILDNANSDIRELFKQGHFRDGPMDKNGNWVGRPLRVLDENKDAFREVPGGLEHVYDGIPDGKAKGHFNGHHHHHHHHHNHGHHKGGLEDKIEEAVNNKGKAKGHNDQDPKNGKEPAHDHATPPLVLPETTTPENSVNTGPASVGNIIPVNSTSAVASSFVDALTSSPALTSTLAVTLTSTVPLSAVNTVTLTSTVPLNAVNTVTPSPVNALDSTSSAVPSSAAPSSAAPSSAAPSSALTSSSEVPFSSVVTPISVVTSSPLATPSSVFPSSSSVVTFSSVVTPSSAAPTSATVTSSLVNASASTSTVTSSSAVTPSPVTTAPANATHAAINNDSCDPSSPDIRIEWSNYPSSDRAAFVDAIKCLQNKPSAGSQFEGSQNRYEDLVSVHRAMSANVHQTAAFLVWHRYFVWVFEDMLRDECGFDRTMPWWDETKHAGAFAASDIFSGAWFGSLPGITSDGQGSCIETGEFANTTLHVGPGTANQAHCLSRAADETQTAQCNQDFTNSCLSMREYDQFRECFELGPHGYGHNGIGAVMAEVTSSVGDPIFFMHHSFIDHTYRIWQNAHPTRRNTIEGCADGANPCTPITLDTVISVMGLRPDVTVGKVLDTLSATLCYRYDY